MSELDCHPPASTSTRIDMNDSTPGSSAQSDTHATELLLGASQGRAEALDELVPLVYDELRRIAARYLRRERQGHSLQPTALVHEAYLRLIDQERVSWQNKAHFLALAARTMRRILVEHARRRAALKRGGELRRTSVEIAVDERTSRTVDVLALDEALEKLEALDPVKRQVVELRGIGGLTIDETAEALQVSTGTVKRYWTSARAWLFREVFGDAE